ncbi:MAG: hypothetical protein QOG54_1408, partial [Actinomycetota bacterium]|nr:hypothetical protein [Actinomycetota bacterium]
DARQIYLQAKTAGYLYQAHLRAELTRRLGLQWTEVRNGTADIDGIPRSVIRAFSKRRAEIEESLGDPSESSGREAQVATLTTRQSKDYKISPNELLPEWRVRAERLGVDAQTFHGLLNRVDYREPTRAQIRTVESDLASADGLTANRSSFTRREAIQGFCDRLQEGAPIAEIEELADAFLSSSRVIPLSVRADNSREALVAASGKVIPGGLQDRRYSTADMLEVERRVIERALERQLDGSGVADEIVVERALSRRPSLYEDQRELIRRLATSGQGVEVVIGRAGTGKTYALAGAREVWESSGYRVVGCALGAFAAQQLQSGSGIPSFTITSLLQDIEHPEFGGLAPNSVLVIDEAGMVGTRTLERLLGHAEKAGTKVVLVGDDRQLPEIEAGGAFRGIKNRMPATELEQVRRQPMGWERDALEHIREGRSQKAIDSYMANDRIVIKGSSEETRRQLVTDWWATQDDQEPAIMIAARRSEVADLNDRARELMSSAGRLGDAIHIEDRSFAVGDRVMTLRNSRGLGVINGTRATVEVVDAQRVEVTIRDDSGRSVTLPRSYLESGHLTHAYAMTGHKTQGMTTDKAFVLGDETLYKEWAYVAMSRGRNDNRLYVVAANDAEREELGGEVATPEDPVKELVRAVGRSKAQELAVDTFDVESDDVYVRERCIEL